MHVDDNNLGELYQSAYKKRHSTETALLKVQDDILRAIDNSCCVILLLLDLSATFDTVDHCILLDRLSERFSITGNALVQSLNSPFFPIGAKPGRAKGESRLRTPPFFPPNRGKNHNWKYFPDFACSVIF